MKGLKYLIAASAGMVYGLLFAQRPGKELRKELSKSEEPLKVLFNECKNVDLEAIEEVTQWAKESEDVQQLVQYGKKQFGDFVEKAKSLSAEGQEIVRQRLETLSSDAHEAAEELKKSAAKKGKELKNELHKEVKTIAKKIKK